MSNAVRIYRIDGEGPWMVTIRHPNSQANTTLREPGTPAGRVIRPATPEEIDLWRTSERQRRQIDRLKREVSHCYKSHDDIRTREFVRMQRKVLNDIREVFGVEYDFDWYVKQTKAVPFRQSFIRRIIQWLIGWRK